MVIRVRNRHPTIRIDTGTLRKLTRSALEALGLDGAECGVLLVSDRRMAALNGRYRRLPRPTDVLAFAMREGSFAAMAGDLLGDVVISLDSAARQARARRAPLEAEVRWLLLHGLLHLAGHEHRTARERRRMMGKQWALLRRVTSTGARQGLEGRRRPRK